MLLVENGFLNPEMPQNHSISRGGKVSNYCVPDIVGPAWAQRNLRRWVQSNFIAIDELYYNNNIKSFHAFCTAIGVKKSTPLLRQRVAELGWLPAQDDLTVSRSLPTAFLKDKKKQSR